MLHRARDHEPARHARANVQWVYRVCHDAWSAAAILQATPPAVLPAQAHLQILWALCYILVRLIGLAVEGGGGDLHPKV